MALCYLVQRISYKPPNARESSTFHSCAQMNEPSSETTDMSISASPASCCSSLESREFVVDQKILKMLVDIIIARHGILHYHPQTRELATFQWWVLCVEKRMNSLLNGRPTDVHGQRIHPSSFEAYREAHIFRYPCCLCASRDTYVEVSILQRSRGPCRGQYVAECMTNTCGYLRELTVLRREVSWSVC